MVRKYGINLKQFFDLLKSQKYKCAICEKKINEHTAYIDHSHTTGLVRGLLCFRCNTELGTYERVFGDGEIILNYINRNDYRFKYSSNHFTRTRIKKQILEDQGYKCAVCGCELTLDNAELDHNHETGFIKGAVCHPCNISVLRYPRLLKYKDKIDTYLEIENGNQYRLEVFANNEEK